MLDALKRSYAISSQIGSMAVIVDPLNEEAKQSYSRYRFIALSDSGKMFIAMVTTAALFDEAGNSPD